MVVYYHKTPKKRRRCIWGGPLWGPGAPAVGGGGGGGGFCIVIRILKKEGGAFEAALCGDLGPQLSGVEEGGRVLYCHKNPKRKQRCIWGGPLWGPGAPDVGGMWGLYLLFLFVVGGG